MPKPKTENLDQYADALRSLPFVESVRLTPHVTLRERRLDAVADLELIDGTTTTLNVELKTSHLGSKAAHYLRETMGPDTQGWILAAPYVSTPLGVSLERLGINFVDREGNCHVRIGNRFLARMQGAALPKPPARSKEMRAPAYQVMFSLLAAPELVSATQREIAAAAGTSRQPVADLLGRLVEERTIVRRRRGHAWVEGPNADLLERWLAGYRSTLRPKLLVGRFRLPVKGPDAVEQWLDAHLDAVRYGGTAGAYRLQPHYRGPQTVVHLGPPTPEARHRIKAVSSPDGDLVWMRKIGQVSQRGVTADTVHPLLIYAELMADPEPRAGEAVEIVRQKWLAWSL